MLLTVKYDPAVQASFMLHEHAERWDTANSRHLFVCSLKGQPCKAARGSKWKRVDLFCKLADSSSSVETLRHTTTLLPAFSAGVTQTAPRLGL